MPSPTFAFVQVYERGPVAIWHYDLYRLKSAEEAWELGIEDAFSEGISLIEWPERLGPLLPQSRLEITFLFRRPARRALRGNRRERRVAGAAGGDPRRWMIRGAGDGGIPRPLRLGWSCGRASGRRRVLPPVLPPRRRWSSAVLMDAPPPQVDVGPYVVVAAVTRLRRFTQLPVAVDFGIRTSEQAARVARAADAAVVGSALVQRLALKLNPDNSAKPGLIDAVLGDVRALVHGMRGARRNS